jgi:hypothetical protein
MMLRLAPGAAFPADGQRELLEKVSKVFRK